MCFQTNYPWATTRDRPYENSDDGVFPTIMHYIL